MKKKKKRKQCKEDERPAQPDGAWQELVRLARQGRAQCSDFIPGFVCVRLMHEKVQFGAPAVY